MSIETRTNFEYSIGEIECIRKATLEKNELTEETDFKKIIDESQESILIPKVIGVYQNMEIINPEKGAQEQFNLIVQRSYEMQDRFLRKLEIVNTNAPNLIHLIYDPRVLTPNILKVIMHDEMERIIFSTPDTMPNFFEKDIQGRMNDLVGLLEGFDVRRVDKDYQKNLYEKTKSISPEIKRDFSKFGLTINEWAPVNFAYIYERAHGLF